LGGGEVDLVVMLQQTSKGIPTLHLLDNKGLATVSSDIGILPYISNDVPARIGDLGKVEPVVRLDLV